MTVWVWQLNISVRITVIVESVFKKIEIFRFELLARIKGEFINTHEPRQFNIMVEMCDKI